MNIANGKSSLLNNSLTSDTQQICNALGCSQLAKNEIALNIGEKSVTIFVCESCKPKFEK